MSEDARRILCIEDNPVNWRLVKRLLEQAGFEMHWAEEGLLGFEMAQRIHPDLVLLDINLPGLSGFEVATKFRQCEEFKTLPIVALTAKIQRDDRDTALVAGCDGFIPKPIDPFTFVSQVEGYLGGRREHVEASREGEVRAQLNVQVLQHLEAQLKEATETNRKLVQTQEALTARNASLQRLLALSRSLLTEHDPRVLLARILEEVRGEVGAQSVFAYHLHASGGYWEGFRLNSEALEEIPTLPLDHPFVARIQALAGGADIIPGELLRSSRASEDGLLLGFWQPSSEICLLLLKDRQRAGAIRGFWAFARETGHPFAPEELEMMALHASHAQVSLENAELIGDLNESSRALASSYERMEAAYQDLSLARVALSQKDRQGLLEELFFRIAKRLEQPVATLSRQSTILDRAVDDLPVHASDRASGESAPKAMAEIRGAVSRIDGLLKALLRRVGKDAGRVPEWVDLHDLIQQEMELLEADGTIPSGVRVEQELRAPVPMIFGIYGDFARLLQGLLRHALGGPMATEWVRLRTWREDDMFHMEVMDEGGVIPPCELDGAFEPFSGLHQTSVTGVRRPGEELPACRQILAPYQGDLAIRNAGDGTTIHAWFPLRTAEG